MLLEFWAYILDVTGFYDARIAERSYLATAPDAETLARIVRLVGYRPRPAMAARVLLALEADDADPVAVPAGTAFRSEPFDDEPPQVFELLDPATICHSATAGDSRRSARPFSTRAHLSGWQRAEPRRNRRGLGKVRIGFGRRPGRGGGNHHCNRQRKAGARPSRRRRRNGLCRSGRTDDR